MLLLLLLLLAVVVVMVVVVAVGSVQKASPLWPLVQVLCNAKTKAHPGAQILRSNAPWKAFTKQQVAAPRFPFQVQHGAAGVHTPTHPPNTSLHLRCSFCPAL